MDYKERWEIIAELGSGGQGKVYKVLDQTKIDLDRIFAVLKDGIGGTQFKEKQIEQFRAVRKAIVDIVRAEDADNQGALKVLHLPQGARDAERAEERIAREIRAMLEVTHPNLLRILDADTDSKWFVSDYHPRGALDQNPLYKGDFVRSLRAFRGVIEGVAELHKKGFVHRDIKPHNVFVGAEARLVLGDFGLVFFRDDQRTRLSGTWENVGSRDWMPPWAMSMRIEDIRPSFDVFCLGKLLWSMINPNSILQLWYYDRPQFNLEQVYPDAPYIYLAKRIFQKCIVENEKDCLGNAVDLLLMIDKLLQLIDRQGDVVNKDVKRICKVCGLGYYEPLNGPSSQFYLDHRREWDIFVCSHCKNLQLFLRKSDST